MKKRISLVTVAVLAVLFVAASGQTTPFEWNGHLYQVVDKDPITWENAKTDAEGLGTGWTLATITSLEEQNFIKSLLPNDGAEQYWVGGVQQDEQSNPSQQSEWSVGWQWVTGEAWNYTNWAQVYAPEPNDWGQNEQYLTLDRRWGRNWTWNDASNTERLGGYVAERVPEPGTIILLGAGLLGLAVIRRKVKI